MTNLGLIQVRFGGQWLLPAMLSMTAGAVDVIGFLSLGMFTAHITGNLVILAAHYITGRFGEIGPIASVPIFMIVLALATLAFVRVATPVARRALLLLQLILLVAFLGLSIALGPFSYPDHNSAVFVSMIGVAAMAIQNAVVRLALPGSPSTAVMTTNTALLAVDLAKLIRRRATGAGLSDVRHRAYLTFASVAGFVIGLIFSTILEVKFGLWSLAFPVVLAALAIPLGESWSVPE